MSITNFHEICSKVTREHAINTILTSIVTEELAFRRIISSEEEKLQYAFEMLETSRGEEPNINELLCVSQSISNLLEIVSENQILLKNKMGKLLQFFTEGCLCSTVQIEQMGKKEHVVPKGDTVPTGLKGKPGPVEPACICPHRHSAVFKGVHNCKFWKAGCVLPWINSNTFGKCACLDPCNSTKIQLCSKNRFLINFLANVNNGSICNCDVAVSLQVVNAQHHLDIFTFKNFIPYADTKATISMNGIILDTFDYNGPSSIVLKLVSPDSLIVEDVMLSIVET